MKSKVNLLSLNRESEMSRKEMKAIRIGAEGGLVGSMCANYSACACGCRYADTGGSSTEDNFEANALLCKHSSGVDYENADLQHVIY
jgi:hypothetical protein